MFRDERYSETWTASGNALNAVFVKEPAEMTRDDVMTVACDAVAPAVHVSQGYTAHCVAAVVDESTFFVALAVQYPLGVVRAPGDEANLRLAMLALEICRDPQGLSERQLAGVWNCLFLLVTQRAELGAAAAKGGIFDAAAAELRELEHCLRVACANDRLTRGC